MANKYLHQVTALGAAPASGDLFHITDVSDTTDLAQGTSKSITYANLLSGISITESQISDLGSYITLTDLSVGSEATASGDGAISYSNSTGVFTYTPPTLAGLNGSIDDLSDVTLTSTATNDILRWNGSAFVNTDSPTLDALQFDLTAAETAAVGQLAWNSEDLTLDLGLDTNVTLQIGQEQLARIKAASAIRNGMAVYVSGVTGGSDNLEGTPFSANSGSGVDELRFLGIATETLSTNDIGFVTTFGKVRGVDGTTYASGGIRDNADTESWSVGDILYASPNIAGTLTSVVPTSPDRQMPIAIVLKVAAETNLTLFARAEHGYHLNELHDVLISGTPADNEVLAYDSASGNWINNTLAEAGIAATGHTHAASDITSGTFADARIAQSNVTQHQAALSITESQISDLGSYITASSTDNLTNKTFSDNITVAEIAPPSTPSTGFGTIYAKTDGKLYFKNDAGTETDLTAGAGAGSGSVTSVDMSVPTGFAISGNPITTSGTLALAFDTGYSLPSNATQASWITASSTDTLTNKTFDANGTGNSLSNVETADIASGSKSGSDTTLVTGTAGTNGNLVSWNADGDAVDSSIVATNVALTDGDTYTGTHDFGGATLEIPNAAAPSLSVAGQIALDTSTTDHTALLKYHDGTNEFVIPAILSSGLSTTDNDVIAYNAANNRFEMEAQSGAGGGIALTDLSVGNEASASGDGAISYDNTTGVFTYTPPTAAGISAITASSTDTLTNKTFDANGTGNSLSNIETADIASGSKSGSDTTLITGTAGTDGNVVTWNADGDAVDSGYAVSAFVGGVNYQGTWNASTNSPTISAASSSNKGYYYKVSVAGSTSIDGETDWKVGDWIISNGTTWDKVDNTESVSSVFGRTGAVTASFSDISGTATHEQGGLEADVSAYSGLIKISGGATSAITDNSSDWDTAFGWGDHSLEGYLTNIDAENFSSLADVTITSIASGEILKWSGTAWINNTLAEAGIAATGHTHAASDITSGTFADARIAQSNVTQHQAALSITESQISDLGSYISNLVEDTTPQLGGQLDVNGNAIGDGTRELLTFTEDGSAVNHINIENEATGSGPIISAAGDDTNIDLNLSAKGTGDISLGTMVFDADQTIGAGQDNYVLTYDNATGKISLEAAAGGGGGTVTSVDMSVPTGFAISGNPITSSGTLALAFDTGYSLPSDATQATWITASSTTTFTNKTFDANGTGNSLSNVETADIASGSKTGSDTTLVTGTAGTNGNLVSWNADGDAVDSSVVAANVITTSNTASTSASGIVELATAAETTTGTDTGRAVTPDGLAGSDFGKTVVTILVSDPNGDAITAGNGKAYWRVPSTINGYNLVDVEMAVTTASTSGNPTVQIHNVTDTADMLSTSLSIDANETDSSTAATAAVINTSTDDVATADMLRIDIDAAGTGTTGLMVELTFQLP
jgi:hypothetical protein